MDMLRFHGIEYAPPEITAMASATNPEEVGAMAERAGSRMTSGMGAEYHYQLDDVRKQVDNARMEVEKSAIKAGVDMAQTMSETLKSAFPLIADAFKNANQQRQLADFIANVIAGSMYNK
jgi:hypothetical protein